MSGLFKSKKSEGQLTPMYDPYAGLRNKTSSWLESQIGKPAEPYTGEFVAPMTDEEKKSTEYLNQYAEGGPSESTKLVGQEIQKTLSGGYDPSTSPYYQAVKAQTMKNNRLATERLNQRSSMGGRYFSGGRVQAQSDLEEDTTNELNRVVYGLADKERQRKLDLLPFASEFGRSEEEAPLRKTSALQEYGQLPRAIQQALLDAKYGEFLSANREYPMNIAAYASNLAGQEPWMKYKRPSTRRSFWDGMFGGDSGGGGSAIGSIGGGLLGQMFGIPYPVGSAAGGAIGGMF